MSQIQFTHNYLWKHFEFLTFRYLSSKIEPLNLIKIKSFFQDFCFTLFPLFFVYIPKGFTHKVLTVYTIGNLCRRLCGFVPIWCLFFFVGMSHRYQITRWNLVYQFLLFILIILISDLLRLTPILCSIDELNWPWLYQLVPMVK